MWRWEVGSDWEPCEEEPSTADNTGGRPVWPAASWDLAPLELSLLALLAKPALELLNQRSAYRQSSGWCCSSYLEKWQNDIREVGRWGSIIDHQGGGWDIVDWTAVTTPRTWHLTPLYKLLLQLLCPTRWRPPQKNWIFFYKSLVFDFLFRNIFY